MKVDFHQIKSYQKDLVLKNITYKWKPIIYPDIMTEELAIEKYKLNYNILKNLLKIKDYLQYYKFLI